MCTPCNVFNDAFGSTQLDTARADIWHEWQSHMVKFHDARGSFETVDSTHRLVIVGELMLGDLDTRETLYVVR